MMPGPAPHFIGLGNGQCVRVSDYVAGIRLAKANPDRTFRHGLGGWWPETGAEVVRAYRRHVDTVINRRAGIEDNDRDALKQRAWRMLCKRIEAGRLTRRCVWRGQGFTPRTVNDRFDDPGCAEAYSR